MRGLLLFLVLNCAMFTCYASKPIVIKGKLLSAEDSTAIQLANVYIKGSHFGTTSNKEGKFSIPIPEQYHDRNIAFSSIMTMPKEISIFELSKNINNVIYLESSVYELQPVTALLPQNVLVSAIKRIEENYTTTPFAMDCFYRQYHLENGKCVRLIETNVEITDNGYIKDNAQTLQQRIKVNQMRRSEVYERNGDTHGDHIVDLLLENAIRYNGKNILNLDRKHVYKWRFKHDNTLFDNDVYHCIYFQKKSSVKESKITTGEIYIHKEDFGIKHIHINRYKNPRYKSFGTAVLSNWRYQNGEISIDYKRVDGKYHLNSLVWGYNHTVIDDQVGGIQYTVEENFELYTDSLYVIDFEPTHKNGHKKAGNLYFVKYPYSKEYWDNYHMLERYPTDSLIFDGLSKYDMPLLKQFENNAKK